MVRTLCYFFAALSTLSLLLPLESARRGWRMLSRGRRLFAGYLVLELASAVALFAVGRLGIFNLWIAHLVIPIQTAIIVLAFSTWQSGPGAAWVLRLASPFMLLFWLPVLFGLEPLTGFTTGSESAQAILCLGIGAYTIVTRQLQDSSRAAEEPWFWIGAGVMLYFATFALLNPLAEYLIKQASQTVFAVLTVRSGMQVLANVLYFRGMQCQQSRQNSGPSISPRPPWPSSSWSRQAPP